MSCSRTSYMINLLVKMIKNNHELNCNANLSAKREMMSCTVTSPFLSHYLCRLNKQTSFLHRFIFLLVIFCFMWLKILGDATRRQQYVKSEQFIIAAIAPTVLTSTNLLAHSGFAICFQTKEISSKTLRL